MKPSEVIREARSLLFEDGWVQMKYGTRPGMPHCIRGAVFVAAQPMEQWGALWTVGTCPEPVNEVLALATGDALHGAPGMGFNDTPGRTFSEVVEALDRAEKFAEQRESDA